MGIPGLTHFLDGNVCILEDNKLVDINVIVDGSNLAHFLYYYYNVSHVYGGDYKVYAEACAHFFETLRKCSISPYVIFDGAYHPRGKKFTCSVNRAAKRASASADVVKGGSERILPLMSVDVFVEVLRHLSVKYAFCNFESDCHIASLAALWKCPVMTNDSDFFIFDLPGGVILLDYLNVNVKEDNDGMYYLDSQIYYSSNLAKWAGLPNTSLLPLFATLMGNDVINGDIFLPFFKRNDYFSKIPGLRLKKNERKKIPGTLKWLAMKRNLSTATEEIVESFHVNKQQLARELIEKSLASYWVGQTFLPDYFENDLTDKELETITGPIPEWLQQLICKGVLAPRILNAFVSQRCILLPQVESLKCVSSHSCSLLIRQRIYGILLTKERQQIESEHEFREYDRERQRIVKKLVKAETKLDDGSNLLSLFDMPLLSKDIKLKIILDVFDDSQKWFLNFPPEEQLFLASLIYSVNHANPKIGKNHVLSLLIFFYDSEILKKLMSEDTDEGIYQSLEATVSYLLGKAGSRLKYFDVNQIHSFSQFQACFQSLSDLNKLLFLPFVDISITKIFCATSLAYICHQLESSLPNIFEFLASVMQLTALDKIRSIWMNLGFSPNEKVKAGEVNKNRKRAKAQKTETQESQLDDYDALASTSLPMMFNVDIENKFSKLSIDDNP